MNTDFNDNQYFAGERTSGAMAHAAPQISSGISTKRTIPYGMDEAEYESYVIGCQDTLEACNDYLAFYTQHANAPFAV
ncbi:hypothetical protein FUA23_17915 [Neolewinella aurantiaca]|uniref:Uncharacterized protein n=1 Tax=Neolewinella aurantiaca TaxID=2602767 RepID=A0A5C7FK21_9BACT|nr:hypothetical protein [Neolewinella aurantiaca]TXF87687.1 hypothetical protein FUA23_17915 [Neolewinella aurantiaca]